MKNTTKKNYLIIGVLSTLVISITFSSCKNDEDGQVSQDFIVSTDSLKSNSEAIESFISELKSAALSMEMMKPNLKQIQPTMTTLNEDVNRKKFVSLKSEIAKIFQASNNPCSLPNKVKNKLKDKSFAPSIIATQIKRYSDSVLSVNGESVSAVLNTVTIVSANGSSRRFPILSSPSFKAFRAQDYLINGAYDNFIYSLDCSGYMNAAIQGSGIAVIGEASTNAKLALESQNTMFVAGGTLASPVYSAYYGNVLGTALDTTSMIGILKSVLLIPNLKDSDSIKISPALVVIWASKTGKGSFNGSGEISGKIGTGIGIASFSSSGGSGGQISRESSFSNYDTYIVDTDRLSQQDAILVSNIKTRVNALDKKVK